MRARSLFCSGFLLHSHALRVAPLSSPMGAAMLGSRRALSRMVLETAEEKALYALGSNIGRQLGDLKVLDAIQLDSVLEGAHTVDRASLYHIVSVRQASSQWHPHVRRHEG